MGRTLRTSFFTCVMGCFLLAVPAAQAQVPSAFPDTSTSGRIERATLPDRPAYVASVDHRSDTAGVVASAAQLSVSDTTGVAIHEFLTEPDPRRGDANGDGVYSARQDAFVEIVNTGDRRVDIGGWQLAGTGSSSVMHTFPFGTVLPPGSAIVVFGGGAPPAGLGGAEVQTATGAFNFADNTRRMVLYDGAGNPVDEVPPDAMRSVVSGQSMTADPDADGRFRPHRSVGTDDRLFSPGTRSDGTSFGPFRLAHRLDGDDGWRMISTPARNTSFGELLAPLWTEGIPGSDAVASGGASVYEWAGRSRRPVAIHSMDGAMAPGRGYLVYAYRDDNQRKPGVQGGFPKVIGTNNRENGSPVTVTVQSIDHNGDGIINYAEGYNLLGNPFGVPLAVDALLDALESASSSISANIVVWDPSAGSGNGRFVNLRRGSGGTIAPYQAFFVRYMRDAVKGDVALRREELRAEHNEQEGETSEEDRRLRLRLRHNDRSDVLDLVFQEGAEPGTDRLDGYKLLSLNSGSVNLFSTVGEGIRLARSVLPSLDDLEGSIRIPLAFTVPGPGSYTLDWEEITDLPRDVNLYLTDSKTGRNIDLQEERQYLFDVEREAEAGIKEGGPGSRLSVLTASAEGIQNGRFELLLESSAPARQAREQQQENITISPNYPNPFSNQTTMDLELQENMHVTITVWNIVAQKVATLADRMMEAGPYQITWNAPANIPSGIYICKVEAGGKVLTRKMTLVK